LIPLSQEALWAENVVSPSLVEMPIQEMIDCIVQAGYAVTKSDRRGQSG